MVVTALVTEQVSTIFHHHKGSNIKLSPVKCLPSAFYKAECVFLMVVVSIHAETDRNDHQEDAPYFIKPITFCDGKKSTNGINELHNAPNPVFILFLDAVSQLIFQNPTSFEFSSFFLETLAYHTYSGRFSTFLLDSGKLLLFSAAVCSLATTLC